MLIPSVLAEGWSIRANTDLPEAGVTNFRLNLHSANNKGEGSIFFNIDNVRASISLKQVKVITHVSNECYYYSAKSIIQNLDTRKVFKFNDYPLIICYEGGDHVRLEGFDIPVTRLR